MSFTARVSNLAPATAEAVEVPVVINAPEPSALEWALAPLQVYLRQPELTELCINRPGEVFLESSSGWRREAAPALDFGWCRRFAKLVANYTRQRVDAASPLLSASLPTGERVQVVLPPATSAGTVAIAIRRPASEVWSLETLAARGIFRALTPRAARQPEVAEELTQLLATGDYTSFMRRAVLTRQNILVSGPTGSGKTTWTKALIREIPSTERLIVIEDAAELVLDRHPNHVRLFYSKDDQGLARVHPKQLLESCLRMRPDRILLAELRAEEAFDYLRNVNSGHPGSITSVHAGSCSMAFEQLVLLIKQSVAGRALARHDIKHLLRLLIDVVIQFGIDGQTRVVKDIWYAPARRAARTELTT